MATETTKPTQPVAAPAEAPLVPKGPRNYLVMMLLAVLMLPTGLARAYRGEQIGWTRFWIYVGATVASIIPFLNIVAFLVLIALAVWGVVDVFKLYKERTDAEGGALFTSPRDEKFAKGFFVYFIVTLCLMGAFILFMIVFGAFIFNAAVNSQQNFNDMMDNNSSNSRSLESYETPSYYR